MCWLAIHYSRVCVNIYSHLVPSNFMFMQVSDLTSALIDGIKKIGIKTVQCHEPVEKKKKKSLWKKKKSYQEMNMMAYSLHTIVIF